MGGRFRTFNGTRRNTFGKKRYSGYRNFTKPSSSLDISLLVKKASENHDIAEFEITNSFNSFQVSQELKNNISLKGYSIPTPIQDRAIPVLLEGKDVVGIAKSGTGKTAAFLIPILEKIRNNRTNKALIVAPTRELASQIYDECKSFTKNLGIHAALCIGGVGLYGQKQVLRNNPNVVIGTPGRLKDLNNQRSLNFSNYNLIVLDEVDRMLDMGFINDVKFIISCLPQLRQSMFFSATVTREIEGIMHSFLNDPVTISVKVGTSSQNVDQDVVSTYGKVKIEVLHDLLIKDGFDKVLVFARTKRGIEKLANQLKERGFKVVSLHGNKSQNQRQNALEKFKDNQVRILLATDIAARGLDIDDITHVINYDLPQTYEDYVHRIGRTGRANKKGSALSFVD